MKTLIFKTILIIALISGFTLLSSSQNAEQIFQQGIVKEEGEGALKEAIDLYEEVAENSTADRLLRAKSLFQMGICYEKLGQQEARNVYQKIISVYGDQQEIVADARKKLSKLNAVQVDSKNEGILIQKVWVPAEGSSCKMGAPSPNGRYVTFVNWSTIEHAVRDLKTGREWELTNKGSWKGERQFPDVSIWSPDGKQIAYYWFVGRKGDAELHLINADGSDDRILSGSAGIRAPQPTDWSKDGKHILCIKEIEPETNTEKSKTQIVLVSVDDGSEKLVKDLGTYTTTKATFSRNDKYIIYDVQKGSESNNSEIHAVSIEGGVAVPLITNIAVNKWPFHVPKTNQIIFFSDHSGTFDLWSMNFVDGKILGNPKVLKIDIEETFQPRGITENGRLFYSSSPTKRDVFKVKLDFENGEVLSKPENAFDLNPGKNQKGIWSASGTYFACLIRTPFNPTYKGHQLKYIVKNSETKEEYEVITNLYGSLLYWAESVWTVDEKSILVWGNDTKGEHGFFQVDVKTGKHKSFKTSSEPTETGTVSGVLFPQFSPNGELLYSQSDDHKYIMAVEVKTGTEKIIKHFETELDQIILSPDGKYIAFTHWFENTNSLSIISLEDNFKITKIADLDEDINVNVVGWSPNSRELYFSNGSNYATYGIWSASLNNYNGIKKVFTGDQLKEFKGVSHHLRIHKNGKDVLMSLWTGGQSEMWIMENIIQN